MDRMTCDGCGKIHPMDESKYVMGKEEVEGLVLVESDEEKGWCLDCWYTTLDMLRDTYWEYEIEDGRTERVLKQVKEMLGLEEGE